jgi:hypothetical protein
VSVAAPPQSRFLSERATLYAPLAIGAALILTNRWFPAVDDECAIIDRAAQPISYTLHLYFAGVGEHEHPPLYDLVLHGWLRLTRGEMHLLRVPAIAFYALGAWVLGLAAKHLAGAQAQACVLVLLALWPFGFHFGRVAAWYSFCFFMVSLLTWAYLVYLERPSNVNWCWVVVSALLLLYSNYFGWVLLCFLVLDLATRNGQRSLQQAKHLLVGGLILVLAYLPILRAFMGEIHGHVHEPGSFLATFLTGIYNLYCIFVSESVAPWFWGLGVPAAICIVLVLGVALWRGTWPARRFLLYFIGLVAIMTTLRIIETKRLLFIAPWLVLSIAVTLSASPMTRRARQVCVLSLTIIGGIGWYGIFARDLYAAPHWVEPWADVARQAAGIVRSGGIVIGNNPSFFFYLTYSLQPESHGMADSHFAGFLPKSIRHRGVYDPQEWLAAGEPLAPTVFLVQGEHYGVPGGTTALAETERSLSESCVLRDARQMVHDPGVRWKQRFAPKTGQLLWRVHVSTYMCAREPGHNSR